MIDLKKEQESSQASIERCTQLTKQVAELETTLSETRQRLNEALSENRKNELEHAASDQSDQVPLPSKRPRRSTRSSSNASTQVNKSLTQPIFS